MSDSLLQSFKVKMDGNKPRAPSYV